jgi:hypothetical protein
MESKEDAKGEGLNDSERPKTRGFSVEVLLKKGLNNETLGERGSLWCRNPRPQCSLLL